MKAAFKSDDGKYFDTEAEVVAHEEAMNLLKPAEQYGNALAEAGWDGPGLTRRINGAKDYLIWQETGKLPQMPAKKPEPESEPE